MKTGIHPIWYPEAKITCVCGNTFITGSTLPAIRVEICALCHPLFTGQQRFVDTQGQVEKFTKARAVSQTKKAEREKVLQARQAKIQPKGEKPTLKDLLLQARKKSASLDG